MVDIFSGVLITSLYATVVGLVIILIKGILKNKLNAKWHYLIWYVFILKLILPFGPESAVSLFNAMPEMPQQSMTEMAYQMEQQYQASLGAENPLQYGPPTQRQVRAARAAAFGESLLPYIWAAGAALMLLWLVFAYYSLHRKLGRGSFAADERLLYILESCKAKMGIRGNVTLVLQDTVGTPSLFGLLRPRILLIPAVADLSDKEIEYILLHELAHLKRKDVPVNYLLTVLQIIHWFNPVLWHCFKSIRQDMEVATDELVLSVLGSTEHRDYGRAILTVLESFSEFSLAPRLLGMVDDRKNIEKRLKMIKMADFFRRRRIAALAVGLLCVTVLGGVLLTSGLAHNNSPPDPDTAYSAEALFKYRTAYVGENSKVVNLINNLPYAHLRREVSLHTENPPYGITVNYDFSNTDTNIGQIERTFRSNAVVMFALIDNVDAITFKVQGTGGQSEYRYSRAEVQKNFNTDLREYAKDIEGLKLLLKKLNFTLLIFPGKYASTMSSTPGIRILAEYKGPVWKVRYSAEKGVLLTWDATTGNISKSVQQIDLPQGIPVYWSPLGQNGQISEDRSSMVTVELLDEKGKRIDERQLTIIYDGSLFYTVNSSPGIVVGTETPSTA